MHSSSAAARTASLLLGIWRNLDDGPPSWRDVGLAAHVQTSPACQARMRSRARKSRTWRVTADPMARLLVPSPSIWQRFVGASARWWNARLHSTYRFTGRAALN